MVLQMQASGKFLLHFEIKGILTLQSSGSCLTLDSHKTMTQLPTMVTMATFPKSKSLGFDPPRGMYCFFKEYSLGQLQLFCQFSSAILNSKQPYNVATSCDCSCEKFMWTGRTWRNFQPLHTSVTFFCQLCNLYITSKVMAIVYH